MRAGSGAPAASRPTSLHRSGLTAVCAGIVAFTVLALVGDALSSALIATHPLVLVLLAPRTPFLIAAAAKTPLVIFMSVATVRLCIADPLHFAVGRRIGAVAFTSISRSKILRRLPHSVDGRASLLWLLAVGISPTGTTMLIAGAVGLPARRVAVADVVGTLARVLVLWRVGMALPDVVGVIGAFAPYLLTPLCVVLGLAGLVHTRQTLRTANQFT